jgi:hypothetical protein
MSSGNVTRRKKYARDAPSIAGRFGEVRRHRLQRREVEDHEEAGFLPHGDHHQAGERRVLASEPVVGAGADAAVALSRSPYSGV